MTGGADLLDSAASEVRSLHGGGSTQAGDFFRLEDDLLLTGQFFHDL
jgi:hypothetical protein